MRYRSPRLLQSQTQKVTTGNDLHNSCATLSRLALRAVHIDHIDCSDCQMIMCVRLLGCSLSNMLSSGRLLQHMCRQECHPPNDHTVSDRGFRELQLFVSHKPDPHVCCMYVLPASSLGAVRSTFRVLCSTFFDAMLCSRA